MTEHTPVNTVLLLASQGAEAERISSFCHQAFESVTACHGDWGDKLPAVAENWQGDLVVSYCSRWIVPQYLLDTAKVAAINFHPAPPSYPGVGGLNWALYRDETRFGATAHIMHAKVDAGPIFAVSDFPILPSDNVDTLFNRTHLELECLAYRELAKLALGQPIEVSDITWSTETKSRKELDALSQIEPDMAADEIRRRIRATTFGKWRPGLEVGGFRFELAD